MNVRLLPFKFSLMLLTLLFISCTGSDVNTTSSLGTEFTVSPGQRISIAGEDLAVEFKSVANDSRCPDGAQCVWAGNAEVDVELAKTGNDPSTVRLNTAGITGFPDQVDYLNYRIRITDLQPYPAVGSTIHQSDYRATFIVTKL